MEITPGSRWKQGETVMKVVAVTSDGEVGYRIADKPPRENGDGVKGEWADHHCTVANFLVQHTPVVEVAPAPFSASTLPDNWVEVAPPTVVVGLGAGEPKPEPKYPPGSSAAKRMEIQKKAAKK